MNESNKKKEYSTPKLEIYGDVRSITLAVATTGAFDGNRSGTNRRTQS